MKLSLRRVGDKLKILVRRAGFTTKFVQDCCCANDSLLSVWQECCDGNPRIYIPFNVLTQAACTALTVKYGPNCYTVVPFASVTRQEAIDNGYTIVDDYTLLTCVKDNPGPCGEPPCRVCPQQCCLTAILPKGCRTELDPSPQNNLCCNYGGIAQRTISDIERYSATNYTSLNASQSDTYCPPGCSHGLFRGRQDRSYAYDEVSTFQRCDELGNIAEMQTSCNATFYSTNSQQTRRYGFDGGLDGGCLQYTDTFFGPDEVRNNDCRYQGSLMGFDFPDPVNGECDIYDRIEIADPDNNEPPGQWTYTTNLLRERGCFSGSFTHTITGVKRASPGSECPPPGTVVATSSYSRVFGYSIRKTVTPFCEGDRFCDNYYGNRLNPPVSTPFPVIGALELL